MILDVADQQPAVEEAARAEELHGKMGSDPEEERLAHSVLENDEQTVRDGQMLSESVDYSLNSFTPDLMFEKLVSNYRDAQRLYGPTIIRELTGYDGRYIEKNLKIKEFQDEIKRNLSANVDRLKKEGLLDEEGALTEHGIALASLVLYTDELDHLRAHGIGRREFKERAHYGEKGDSEKWRKQRYKDLDIKGSVRRAVRRGRGELIPEDLRAHTRRQHGRISVVYALDSSGSMRGEKISISKKAGIALAYQAMQDQNDVGLIVFTSKVEQRIPPTKDFAHLLRALTLARAGQETDIRMAIEEALTLFARGAHTKHLVVITDALPTRGKDPERLTLEAASAARSSGITVSIVGINLEREGEKLARKIAEIGEGKLYRVRNLEEIDAIVLEDYEQLKQNS